MSQLHRRLDPAKTVALERELREEGRASAQGMDRAAEVVNETGQRNLARTAAPADRWFPLDQLYRLAGPGQGDGCGKSVGPAAHHDRVEPAALTHGGTVGHPALGSQRYVTLPRA